MVVPTMRFCMNCSFGVGEEPDVLSVEVYMGSEAGPRKTLRRDGGDAVNRFDTLNLVPLHYGAFQLHQSDRP